MIAYIGLRMGVANLNARTLSNHPLRNKMFAKDLLYDSLLFSRVRFRKNAKP